MFDKFSWMREAIVFETDRPNAVSISRTNSRLAALAGHAAIITTTDCEQNLSYRVDGESAHGHRHRVRNVLERARHCEMFVFV